MIAFVTNLLTCGIDSPVSLAMLLTVSVSPNEPTKLDAFTPAPAVKALVIKLVGLIGCPEAKLINAFVPAPRIAEPRVAAPTAPAPKIPSPIAKDAPPVNGAASKESIVPGLLSTDPT